MPGEIVIGNRQIRAAACETALACQLPQEFLLVHVVLEGFPAIDEDDWDLIVELPAKFRVRVNVNILPGESSAPRKLGQTLLDHFTKVAALARVDNDAARLKHATDSSAKAAFFQ
jgi:hypothetical protein